MFVMFNPVEDAKLLKPAVGYTHRVLLWAGEEVWGGQSLFVIFDWGDDIQFFT